MLLSIIGIVGTQPAVVVHAAGYAIIKIIRSVSAANKQLSKLSVSSCMQVVNVKAMCVR